MLGTFRYRSRHTMTARHQRGIDRPLPISIPMYTIVFNTTSDHPDWSGEGNSYTSVQSYITIVIARDRAHAAEQAEEILTDRFTAEERSRTKYEMGSIGDLVDLGSRREG